MAIVISPSVRAKLREKHNVTEDEVRQCFENYEGSRFLKDTREDHATDPPTWWFISETNRCRKLKVAFMAIKVETPNGPRTQIIIKTAFEPGIDELEVFERFGSC